MAQNSVFHTTDLWGWMGAAAFLIFIYLILTNWSGANALLGTTLKGTSDTFKTLQGR